MTDYWKSHEKHWCEYCRTWIQGDVVSIKLHEQGKRHKDSVRNFLFKKRKEKKEAEQQASDVQRELLAIEKAARSAGDTAHKQIDSKQFGSSVSSGRPSRYKHDEKQFSELSRVIPPPPQSKADTAVSEHGPPEVAHELLKRKNFSWPWYGGHLPVIPPPPVPTEDSQSSSLRSESVSATSTHVGTPNVTRNRSTSSIHIKSKRKRTRWGPEIPAETSTGLTTVTTAQITDNTAQMTVTTAHITDNTAQMTDNTGQTTVSTVESTDFPAQSTGTPASAVETIASTTSEITTAKPTTTQPSEEQFSQAELSRTPYYATLPPTALDGEYSVRDSATSRRLTYLEGEAAAKHGLLDRGVVVEAAWEHVVPSRASDGSIAASIRDVWHAAIIESIETRHVPNTEIIVSHVRVLFARYGTFGTVKMNAIRLLLGETKWVENTRHKWQKQQEAATYERAADGTVYRPADEQGWKQIVNTSESIETVQADTEAPQLSGWSTIAVRDVDEEEEEKKRQERERHEELLDKYAAGIYSAEDRNEMTGKMPHEEKQSDPSTSQLIEEHDDEDVVSSFNPFGSNVYKGVALCDMDHDARYMSHTTNTSEVSGDKAEMTSDKTVKLVEDDIPKPVFKKRKVAARGRIRRKSALE